MGEEVAKHWVECQPLEKQPLQNQPPTGSPIVDHTANVPIVEQMPETKPTSDTIIRSDQTVPTQPVGPQPNQTESVDPPNNRAGRFTKLRKKVSRKPVPNNDSVNNPQNKPPDHSAKSSSQNNSTPQNANAGSNEWFKHPLWGFLHSFGSLNLRNSPDPRIMGELQKRCLQLTIVDDCVNDLIRAIQSLFDLSISAGIFLSTFKAPIQFIGGNITEIETVNVVENSVMDVGEKIIKECKTMLLLQMGQQVTYYGIDDQVEDEFKKEWLAAIVR
jgi:hypothetical protein